MNLNIGARIRELRLKNGVTQQRFADALGITGQAVSKWEMNNGYPDIECITPIANFFGVTIDELFGHDTSEKQKKIDEHLKTYDDMFRDWKPSDERIAVMRNALAEFPADERLLVRLATALWYKWNEWRNDDGFDGYTLNEKSGRYVHDFEKYRAHEGWREPLEICEELMSSSVDNEVRGECKTVLTHIYAAVGERDKAAALAKTCPDCEDTTLWRAFNGIYDEEAEMYNQRLMIGGLSDFMRHLLNQSGDPAESAELILQFITLYRLVFCDGRFGFYNAKLEGLYIDLAVNRALADRPDDAFDALEHAAQHASAFDEFLIQLRADGEFHYTAPFVDRLSERSEDVYASKLLSELIDVVLCDKNDTLYKHLHTDPRYDELINRLREKL